MSETDPNRMAPEDDLQAALAEIERMSREDAAAIPSLDDGNVGADPDESVAQPPLPESGPEPANVESSHPREVDAPSEDELRINAALAQLEAVASAADESPSESRVDDAAGASTTGSEPEGSGRPRESDADPAAGLYGALGNDELQAALEEVETITASPKDGPSPRGTGPADTPGQASDEPGGQRTRGESIQDSTVVGQDVATAAGQSKRLAFRVKAGPQSTSEAVAVQRPPEEHSDSEPGATAVPPVAPLGKRVSRTLDRALDGLNQPFGELRESTRRAIGIVALTTLIVSILAMVLMPLVLPHRDGITYLREKRAQLEAQSSPPARESSESSS